MSVRPLRRVVEHRGWLPRAGRRCGVCLAAAAVLWSGAGCHSVIRPAAGRSAGAVARVPLIGDRIEKQRLQQEVEADAFPSASQVGL